MTNTHTPISLHPENPHYLLFRDEPTMLVSAGEHYGAVVNPDFDYVRYLDELARCGMNLTRLFCGSYVETPGSFGIELNTLMPKPGRFLAPWARSATPGYPGGGNKFDLAKWDPTYLARLKDFLGQAGARGIVVELVFFCSYYKEEHWQHSPLNAACNINDIGDVPREAANTLQNAELVQAQEALVRYLVIELNAFDNLYYEICNEPYSTFVPEDWQRHIADVIVETEQELPQTHLIAQNIANGTAAIQDPHPAVSIFNFHYAEIPECIAWNYHWQKPIAFDETGFRGTDDSVYRKEAWRFLMAGGAIFDHLDYSFAVGHEDGSATQQAPGGGSKALRQQLKVLRDFITGFDFLRLQPDTTVVRNGLFPYVNPQVLSIPGQAYAIYIDTFTTDPFMIALPAGDYALEWVSTMSGQVKQAQQLTHAGDGLILTLPPYVDDIALRILRSGD